MNKLRVFFIILFSFFAHQVVGQNTEIDELFDQGFSLYQRGLKDSSIQIFKKILLLENEKENYLYGASYYNIPIIYLELENYDEGLKWFKRIAKSDLKDDLETGDLMEPHANFKHNSSIRIANIYERNKEYVSALNWINKADTLHRYFGFEGSSTSVSKSKASLLSRKVELLEKLNKENLAIGLIINEILNSGNLETFFRKNEEQLFKLIKKKKFKTEYKKSIDDVKIHELNDRNYRVTLSLFDIEYSIYFTKDYEDFKTPHYFSKVYMKQGIEFNKKYVVDYLKKRNFYKSK